GFASLFSYLAITMAMTVSLGFLHLPSLAMMSLAECGLLAAACLRWPESIRFAAQRMAPLALVFVVVAELAGFGFVSLRLYQFRNHSCMPLIVVCLLLTTLILSYIWRQFPWPRLRVFLILGTYLVLGSWHIILTPAPTIDVWS